MQEKYILPATTLAVAILERTHPKTVLTEAIISSAFLQAYQALELAETELDKEHSRRSAESFRAMGS